MTITRRFMQIAWNALLFSALGSSALAAERARLTDANWDEFAPQGKEVDCILGDVVLRNDLLVAVIAQPRPDRNANMTVRNVGGCVIDLTCRDRMNDQLSAYYPGAGSYTFQPTEQEPGPGTGYLQAEEVTYACRAEGSAQAPAMTITYRLRDGSPYLVVETVYHNPYDQPVEVTLQDSLRADRGFQFDYLPGQDLFWAYDEWWPQAYGIRCPAEDCTIEPLPETVQRGRPVLRLAHQKQTNVSLAAGQSLTITRHLLPAANVLDLLTRAAPEAHSMQPVRVVVRDPAGPVSQARVTVTQGEQPYGTGRTNEQGQLSFGLPPGSYRLQVEALGRPAEQATLTIADRPAEAPIAMQAPGYVTAQIVDDQGQPVPCKVQFRGRDGTSDPFFGPDTMIEGIHNLRYTADGRFRQAIAPGHYDVIISRGNEYDAIFTTIDVQPGQETELTGTLRRSVNTRGWVSSDFHSHSSPSGDNTSSQRGRVLNLLAEHIEFAPCTEHNRVSSYLTHLRHFEAESLLATCSGIELTGSPLPINHQNAFPLKRYPRTQDGGGPQTDPNPVVQIERLALWDNGNRKVVQSNHPNLVQMIGDRDQDGQADGGFEAMFGYMDVIEVHPPESIFSRPNALPQGRDRGNVIFNWMQLLNLGYRIPGVVNTDAHYNFHGSGWLRNYLQSSTDDPAQIQVEEMVHAAEHGHVIMTNGPFLEVRLTPDGETNQKPATAGDDITVAQKKAILHVRIQCPNWLDVNRVQVFFNGVPVPELNFTRGNATERFQTGVVKFDQQLPLELTGDTHVIVATAGEGLTLGPVMGPDRGGTMPVAVSNPIFVDVDGDGFEPNGDMLGLPLPVKAPPHGGHDHPHPHPHD